MTLTDYLVLLTYLLGIFAVGVGLSAKVKNTGDLFSAGGQSPWWASGLSAFMTMFSAGTFVVWGGIAYRLGIVAVMINLCYGVAAVLVGYFVAGHWQRIGIRTPAEFIEKRYGVGPLHFYTWSMMIYRMVGVAVALYSLSVLLVALMPLAEGNPLRDPATGNLSITWAILVFGGIVVLYTMVGGLWAVLMTDVLQFIVLNLAVLFMIPLIVADAGGISSLIDRAPPGFFNPVSGDYTWFFLAGWVAIHFFMVGAEWAFVQRFLCVPSARDAKKSAYLFGILYLVSPMLWLLPPLAYRVINPDADPEQAYVLSCQHVLPIGMLGLMIAAMFSATASMVSSQLNVFAGVLTEDIYKRVRPQSDQRHLLRVGRGMSFVLGAILIALAIAVPAMGGAEDVIVTITSLMVGPLLAPTIWGLFSRRISQTAVWCTAGVCFLAGAAVKFGWPDFFAAYGKYPDVVVGVVLPVAVLTVVQMLSKGTSPGWSRVHHTAQADQVANNASSTVATTFDPTPAFIVSGALMVCGLMMFALLFVNTQNLATIGYFASALILLSAGIGYAGHRKSRTNLSRLSTPS
ncbi:sodium:solute symporter family protein [Crateriforma conspicua]|uniref:Sodium/glucose cotransporter n=1 Tax=Crateriforma conspicua TaxID=2527996 RepID=A0A5C5XY29_9PLAN|nr:sodium:solute symporter family protein [Crateriforma conspicua]TWT67860.1 Sodium/glucose cotransporter [Crateriforma conspicua]